jgi:hypothetical protein
MHEQPPEGTAAGQEISQPLSDERTLALVDLFTVTLSFREHRYALTKDLSKFYQRVEADDLAQHMRRVLWRDCEGSKDMRVYVSTTVNFGDRPAGCIAIAALRETAERYGGDLPEAAWFLK